MSTKKQKITVILKDDVDKINVELKFKPEITRQQLDDEDRLQMYAAAIAQQIVELLN